MRLYHLPPSRSTRVLWLLEEIGEPYDVTVMKGEDRKTDEHLLRHPLGRVPVLEDDEGFLFESAGLCLQLADTYPDAQLNWPLGTHERGLVYQWTLFAMTELEPAIIEVRQYQEDDPARAQAGTDPLGAEMTSGGLSAGEAQLLAFARVFLRDPGLVVLDEASSRLDPVLSLIHI